MMKLLLLPVALGFACFIAGVYGAVHNQISFTVSPEYFLEFKFQQFAIPDTMPVRLGAAWVGVQASWWMGLVIGLPIYLIGLTISGTRPFVIGFGVATLVVVLTTLGVGLAGLARAMATVSADHPMVDALSDHVSQPVRFLQAGQMHNHSYLGGLIGVVTGGVAAAVIAYRSRKARA